MHHVSFSIQLMLMHDIDRIEFGTTVETLFLPCLHQLPNLVNFISSGDMWE